MLWGGDTLPEVVGGALVELLHWVLHHPEHNGLGGGEEDGEDPGGGHHHPEVMPLDYSLFIYALLPHFALLLCLLVSRVDKGLEMLMYLQ